MRVLLVEDDETYASVLAEELRELDNEVTVVAGVREALAVIDAQPLDAMVLDRMMPEVDGITALRWLRGGNVNVPIVMLTALGELADKVAGLEAGADDYVVKPVEAFELNARLHALVRGRRWAVRQPDLLSNSGVSVSQSARDAWGNDRPLKLSEIEHKLLTVLVANAGSVMTRAMLVERVWGYDFVPGTNIVDVHIFKLRQKLIATVGRDPIETVRGMGYRFGD